MKKKHEVAIGKIYRTEKPESKRILFTFRFIIFDHNKYGFNIVDAKELVRKEIKVSKKKMNEEYCGIYAKSTIVGRGKNKHIEFNIDFKTSTKKDMDTIFIVPIKYYMMALKDIEKLEFPYSFL